MNESQINNMIEEIKQLKDMLLIKIEDFSKNYDEKIFDAFSAYHIEQFGSDIKSTIEKNTSELIELMREFELIYKLKEYRALSKDTHNVCRKINSLFNFLDEINFCIPNNENSNDKVEQLQNELSDYGINHTWLIQHGLADSNAYQEDNADGFEYAKAKKGIVIKKYVGTDASVIIPDYIEGIPVIKIADKAFCDMSNVHFLTLPSYLEDIGEYAFQKTSISSIVIPQYVSSIGTGAFKNCKKLESVCLSKRLSIIRSYLFEGCSLLSELDIPYGVTSIGDWVFRGCRKLKNVRIPDTIGRIGYDILPTNRTIIIYCNEGTRAYKLISNSYNLKHAMYEEYDIKE